MGRSRVKQHLNPASNHSKFKHQLRPPEQGTSKSKTKSNACQKKGGKGTKSGGNHQSRDQGSNSQESPNPPQGTHSVSTPFEPWVKPAHLSDKWEILQSKTNTDLTLMPWNVDGIGTKVKKQDIQKISNELGADIIALTEHKKPIVNLWMKKTGIFQ